MKKLWIVLIAILLVGFISADYARSSPRYSPFTDAKEEVKLSDLCSQPSTDFLLQISPFGCTPSVVRSDLLEEQNVPVFCPIIATKINPLIDVDAIDSMSFSGAYTSDVQGVGFYPSRAALGTETNLNNPVFNQVGYAVVLLKKQANASAMPKSVHGNISATISYDIKSAMGVGSAQFYLPLLDETEWKDKKVQYGFWGGRAYIRAESIDVDKATIGIYDDSKRLLVYNLKKGQSSSRIGLPGFDCLAGARFSLDSLDLPDTRVSLRVGEDIIEVQKGESFLENRCRVQSFEKIGLYSSVKIYCQEDTAGRNFALNLSPQIDLSVNGNSKKLGLGGVVSNINFVDNKVSISRSLYVAYIGETKTGQKFAILALSSDNEKTFKNSAFYKTKLPQAVKLAQIETLNFYKLVKNSLSSFGVNENTFLRNSFPVAVIYEKEPDKIEYLFDGPISDVSYPLNSFAKFWQGDTKTSALTTLVTKVKGFDIKFTGSSAVSDEEVDEKNNPAFEAYEKAKEDFTKIFNNDAYAKVKDIVSDGVNADQELGESSFKELIELAYKLDQKKTLLELCEKYKSAYPKSSLQKDVSYKYCKNTLALSSSSKSFTSVLVNGNGVSISLEGIIEPQFEDYGVVVSISSDTNSELNEDLESKTDMTKGTKFELNGEGDSIELVSVSENSAVFSLNVVSVRESTNIRSTSTPRESIETKKISLEEGEYVSNIGKQKYKIYLSKINLRKYARVSLIPEINKQSGFSNFSFNIGIEQRSIKLNPDESKERIKNLNETINDWEEKSEMLGNVIKGMKAGCLATGALLTVKNFLSGLGGSGQARRDVMDNVWYPRCRSSSYREQNGYISEEQCLLKNNAKINSDVRDWTAVMKDQNADIKDLQKGSTEGGFWNRQIDSDKFKKDYQNSLVGKLKSSDPLKLNSNSDPVNLKDDSNVITAINKGNVPLQDLKEIDRDMRLADEGNAEAKERLYNKLLNIQRTNENAGNIEKTLNDLNSKIPGLTSAVSSAANAREVYVNPKSKTNAQIGSIPKDSLVTLITYNSQNYLVQLIPGAGNSYGIDSVYDTDGNKKDQRVKSDIGRAFNFVKTSTTYSNPYENAEVKYYDSGSNKALPEIIPFDKQNGWYVYVPSSYGGIGSSSTKPSYDASGVPNSYWICNVGPNKLEEKRGGDDYPCFLYTSGSTATSFPGISDDKKAKQIIQSARDAIEVASRAKNTRSGNNVNIGGENFPIGEPSFISSGSQCTDVMSPKECQLLFNLCDPVICPSSRCDFGGAHPVKDVIQSGIVGSILLCLPNIREGVYIPICLSGVKAGIDGFLSILKSHRDCLQTSVTTGQMTGICDEIYSIHLCEFFWRQGLPLAKMLIPKLFSAIAGQNVRGGGEYLTVQSSWDNAEKSVNYFVDNYAVNAFKAFNIRSAEEVGSAVCRNFASANYPAGADFFDLLTEPDSPSQFHGSFQETPYSSVVNPPLSQYKVFYHIYAGNDRQASFKVYLRGGQESTYYQEASTRLVDSGYIEKGNYKSETKDFTAPAGYKELCIMVNEQLECGFNQVSTSFALDWLNEKAVQDQVNNKVKTSKDCTSGRASIYNTLDLNVQSMAENALNPNLEGMGIVRVCSSESPGKTTDPNYQSSGARWIEVGYCDDQKIKCWLDSSSVKDVIKNTNIENASLKQAQDINAKILDPKDKIFKSDKENGEKLKELIKTYKEKTAPVDLDLVVVDVESTLTKVFMTYQKAPFIFLRGLIYKKMAVQTLKPSATGGDTNSGKADTETTGDWAELAVNSVGEGVQVTINLRSSFNWDGCDKLVLEDDSGTIREEFNKESDSFITPLISGLTNGNYKLILSCSKNGEKVDSIGVIQKSFTFPLTGDVESLVTGNADAGEGGDANANTANSDIESKPTIEEEVEQIGKEIYNLRFESQKIPTDLDKIKNAQDALLYLDDKELFRYNSESIKNTGLFIAKIKKLDLFKDKSSELKVLTDGYDNIFKMSIDPTLTELNGLQRVVKELEFSRRSLDILFEVRAELIGLFFKSFPELNLEFIEGQTANKLFNSEFTSLFPNSKKSHRYFLDRLCAFGIIRSSVYEVLLIGDYSSEAKYSYLNDILSFYKLDTSKDQFYPCRVTQKIDFSSDYVVTDDETEGNGPSAMEDEMYKQFADGVKQAPLFLNPNSIKFVLEGYSPGTCSYFDILLRDLDEKIYSAIKSANQNAPNTFVVTAKDQILAADGGVDLSVRCLDKDKKVVGDVAPVEAKIQVDSDGVDVRVEKKNNAIDGQDNSYWEFSTINSEGKVENWAKYKYRGIGNGGLISFTFQFDFTKEGGCEGGIIFSYLDYDGKVIRTFNSDQKLSGVNTRYFQDNGDGKDAKWALLNIGKFRFTCLNKDQTPNPKYTVITIDRTD